MSPSPAPTLEQLRVGRVTGGWALGMLALLLAAAWGAYAWSVQLSSGLGVTSLRTVGRGGASWGLYVAFDVYFVGVSFAGITVAALVRLFGLDVLRPLTRAAELLTIVSLLAGGLSILADLGRPFHGLWYLPLYARPASPFFGTFTLVVAGYLFASLVYFYLAGRADAAFCARGGTWLRALYQTWATGYRGTGAERARHFRASFWLSLFVLPLLVAAHSTLGFVFGIQGGRPGWFSALQAPGFVVLAGASGISVLIVVSAALRRAFRLEDVISVGAFRLLGNFVWILTATYLYFMLVEELTASYAASTADTHVAHAIVAGSYVVPYWITVGCFLSGTAILFVQFLTRTRVAWAVLAAVLINVGAVLKRLLIVVPSQTHGMLLPFPEGSYVPNWVEISVVVGFFAFAGLLYLTFLKVFPIVPLTHPTPPEPTEIEEEAGTLRLFLFWGTLSTGLAVLTLGLLFSFRVGTTAYQDPVIPFSPVIFIVGVMMTFYSAAIYETIPPPAEGDLAPRDSSQA